MGVFNCHARALGKMRAKGMRCVAQENDAAKVHGLCRS
jgi:hypothetical protein